MACQCPKCGASCPEEATVCPDCGCSLEDRRKGSLKYIWHNPNKVFDKPMRWYQFLVNFGFVIFLFRDIRSCYDCFHYVLFSEYRTIRYAINPRFEIWDWIDSFGYAATFILGIIAWRRLERFRKNTLFLYFGYRWLHFFMHDIGLIIEEIAMGHFSEYLHNLIYPAIHLVIIIAETIYFRKRQEYFLY